jgi:hypothetical protein
MDHGRRVAVTPSKKTGQLCTANNILESAWIDFKNEMLINVTVLYNILKSGNSTMTKPKFNEPCPHFFPPYLT